MDPSVSSLNESLNINQTLNANNSATFYVEEQNSSGLYDSAVENQTNGTTFNSLNGSIFYDLPNYGTGSSSTSIATVGADDKSPNKNSTFTPTPSDTSDNTINNSAFDNINMNMSEVQIKTPPQQSGNSSTSLADATILSYGTPNAKNAAAINASALFIQSESTDTNTSSLDEVDPKSQLANKTIFKSDNPNLSIIEINDNSIKEQDLKNAVVLIESLSEDYDDSAVSAAAATAQALTTDNNRNDVENNFTNTTTNKSIAEDNTTNTKSPNKTQTQESESATDKRRKRAESLLHSSKQKLDIAIAEASAAADTNEDAGDQKQAGTGLVPSNGDVHPDTKREITVYDTIEEFEENLPSTVTLLDTPFGSRVYLVGTAHFSEESQDDVSFVIRNVRPDVVMVELCPSRIHILKLDEKTLLEEAKSFNLAKIRGILHAHGYINGIFFILLLQMSAQIAKDLGMAPGGEFRRAFEEIHRLPGCMLHLGDRPIRITLHRALRALSLWQTIKLVWRLTSTDTISIEEVEECKQRDLLEKLMQEMAGEFPAFSDVFVKERDLFLCHSLQLAALPQTPPGSVIPRPVRVVGVVGIGHAKGIAQMWGRVDPQKIPEIMNIPPASLSTRIAKYTVKYGLIGLALYGAFRIVRPRIARIY